MVSTQVVHVQVGGVVLEWSYGFGCVSALAVIIRTVVPKIKSSLTSCFDDSLHIRVAKIYFSLGGGSHQDRDRGLIYPAETQQQ